MKAREIIPGVEWVGAVDWERGLFDALIPLPDRTSYNAYLVRGSEKTALIDAVDPSMMEVLLSRLQGVERIDYIISQHAEQDHSGGLPVLLERYPQAQLLASPRGRDNLLTHLDIAPERIRAVEDGETLSLGDRTLQFHHIPWVHWPDTMATWLVEQRIAFTTDFLGSHLGTGELFASAQEQRVLRAARRYYAEIMMPFRPMAEKNLAKIAALQPAMIAPSHGPVYDHPALILDAYSQWISGALRNVVLLPFISMHGSTLRMVAHLTESLVGRGVAVEAFEMTSADVGEIASALVDAPTLVIGTPTVLGGPHPGVVSAAFLINLLKPRLQHIAVVGSFGWGSRVADQLAEMLASIKAEVLPPVLCKGLPGNTDLELLDALAETIAARHKDL